MTALASVSASAWIPEDDLLLKNAVEAGASLEALAKGAVQFSRRFTVQELKNRWHSLLYDPDISAEASACMVQFEPSASNYSFKSNRSGNCKENVEVLGKRKVESIRRKYHAMRKRIHNVPNADGYMCNGGGCEEHIVLDNEPPVGSYALGDRVLSHFGLQDNVPQDIPHIIGDNLVDFGNCSGFEDRGLPDRNLFNNNDFERKPLSTLDSLNTNLGNVGSEFGGGQHCESPVSDGSASLHQMGFPSPLPRVPLWKTIEDISAPVMPINVNLGDRTVSAEETLTLAAAADGNKPCSSGYAVHSQPTLKDTCVGLNNSTAITDGEFADLSDSLLNFSDENELLFMEADGKDPMDKSCLDNLDSVLLSSPNEVHVDDMANISDPETLISGTSIVIHGSACPAELVVSADPLQSSHSNQEGVHSEVTMPSSTLISNPHSSELQEGVMYCTLNTEDSEIPYNDDNFLPATFASTTQPIFEEACEPAFSSDIQKDSEQAPSLMNKDKNPAPSFKAPQMIGKDRMPEIVPDHQFIGYGNRSELSGDNCLATASRHFNSIPVVPSHHSSAHATPNSVMDGAPGRGVLNVKSREKEAPGTYGEHLFLHAGSGSTKMNFLEPINSLMSDQEESESDDDVPYFSDIEAMILEMDLCPEDQDSYIGSKVSRYQHEDARKVIIRLEQCAQSSMQRAIASQCALAIFYGRHLKHYIKKAEVILGRATNEIDVDIDLSKEGRANKISRRQIRGMRFVFEVNQKSVRRYLANVAKKGQVKSTNFEWSPNGVP
ncbi:uncharacterized protein LOC100266115 isoform X2 [Vitis vinifera]|uniref:uncharacterized protein LOC100266115 isoform X2 n=1 Tax=Vitis vinifera TaxID=29760 RepID=UPI000540061D|nr:uncharacterized protein LOC100266115 isoform X2 [Vitis vinifera]|eukprot:XP_010649083.1 PREDICTED: uncharacterized protein LOC100266115 isoform X2 [Vitis vinifera]